MVEYRIDPKNRAAFLKALARLEDQRRRDGAYTWGVFDDAAEEGRIVETFLVGSWMEHLRQHERAPMPIGSSRTRLTVFTSATRPR